VVWESLVLCDVRKGHPTKSAPVKLWWMAKVWWCSIAHSRCHHNTHQNRNHSCCVVHCVGSGTSTMQWDCTSDRRGASQCGTMESHSRGQVAPPRFSCSDLMMAVVLGVVWAVAAVVGQPAQWDVVSEQTGNHEPDHPSVRSVYHCNFFVVVFPNLLAHSTDPDKRMQCE
jgi:hypothetical protein